MKKFKKFFKNKKILVFLFILVLLAGGLFFWQKEGKEIKGSPEDYEIMATERGVFVENKKAGLFVKVPEGWEAEKMEVGEGSVIFQTLDIEGEEKDGLIFPPLTKGCGIETSITYEKLNFDEIKEDIKEIQWLLVPMFSEFEEIMINEKKALRNNWESEVRGPMITVYFSNDKVYVFNLIWASEEKKSCIQEFDNFLETISID